MPDGSIEQMPETQRVYVTLFIRTLGVSIAVTLLCFLIGYPMAYAMAHAGPGWARVVARDGAHPVLDVAACSDHFVDCDPAATGSAQRHLRFSWIGRRRQPSDHGSQHDRHTRRDDAGALAVHDPAALLGHDQHPTRLDESGEFT